MVGRADDPNSQIGPVIDKANVERIDRLVEDAKRYARIIVRGGLIVDGPLSVGAFYRPSMLETRRWTCHWSKKRYSAPCSALRRSRQRTKRSHARTPPSTVWPPRSSRKMSTAHRGSPASSRRDGVDQHLGTRRRRFRGGGFKYSGIGRARGLRAMEEFQEVKTQFRAVRALGGSSPHSVTMAP